MSPLLEELLELDIALSRLVFTFELLQFTMKSESELETGKTLETALLIESSSFRRPMASPQAKQTTQCVKKLVIEASQPDSLHPDSFPVTVTQVLPEKESESELFAKVNPYPNGRWTAKAPLGDAANDNDKSASC